MAGFLADTGKPSNAWISEYIHPDDRQGVWPQSPRRCRPEACSSWNIGFGALTERWAGRFSRAVPLLDHDGQLIEWIGAASDVTARKQAEQSLREIAERLEQQSRLFEQIASTTPDFIYVFDLEGDSSTPTAGSWKCGAAASKIRWERACTSWATRSGTRTCTCGSCAR
jgi:PAS domain-containing protein